MMSWPAGGVLAVVIGSTLGSNNDGPSACSSRSTSAGFVNAGRSADGDTKAPFFCAASAACRKSSAVNDGRNF